MTVFVWIASFDYWSEYRVLKVTAKKPSQEEIDTQLKELYYHSGASHCCVNVYEKAVC
jgi:hypothetical protein